MHQANPGDRGALPNASPKCTSGSITYLTNDPSALPPVHDRSAFIEVLPVQEPPLFGSHFNPERGTVTFKVEADPDLYDRMKVVLFRHAHSREPYAEVEMQSDKHGRFWVELKGPGMCPGLCYGYRPMGKGPGADRERCPWAIDLYARATTPLRWTREKPDGNPAPRAEDFVAPKSIVISDHVYTERRPAQGELGLRERLFDALHSKEKLEEIRSHGVRRIAEMSVLDTKGFWSELYDRMPEPERDYWKAREGTFDFLRCPAFIQFLKDHGRTDLEIMPVTIWGAPWGKGDNAWGYDALNFFSLDPRLCYNRDPHQAILEFRDAVAELQRNGIEVLVDFVTGHTHEGADRHSKPEEDEKITKGATFGARALYEKAYYAVDADGDYRDATACCNTLRGDTPQAQHLILSAALYFLEDLNVNGLRIDQATIIGRDGELKYDPRAESLQLLGFCKPEGTVITAEPNDGIAHLTRDFPGVTSGYGGRWGFEMRDQSKAFFSGDRNVHEIAWLLGGNKKANSVEAILDGRNEIINVFPHDGMTVFDTTEEMLQGLEQRGLQSVPEFTVMGKSRQDYRVEMRMALARARTALMFSSPGSLLVRVGDEFGRTQDLSKDAWNRPEFLGWAPKPGERPRSAHGLSGRQGKALAQFNEQAIAMRTRLKIFDTAKQINPTWFDEEGRVIRGELADIFSFQKLPQWLVDEYPEYKKLGLEVVSNSRFDELIEGQHFVGAFIPGAPGVPSVYLALWGGGPRHISLPSISSRPKDGMRWVFRHCLDSNTGVVRDDGAWSVSRDYSLSPQMKESHVLFGPGQTYYFPGPGVAAFVMVRAAAWMYTPPNEGAVVS